MRPFNKPYTAIGISRVPCKRCGQPSRYSWQICSLNNSWMGVCTKCDIALNKLVLLFFKVGGWKELISTYRRRVGT